MSVWLAFLLVVKYFIMDSCGFGSNINPLYYKYLVGTWQVINSLLEFKKFLKMKHDTLSKSSKSFACAVLLKQEIWKFTMRVNFKVIIFSLIISAIVINFICLLTPGRKSLCSHLGNTIVLHLDESGHSEIDRHSLLYSSWWPRYFYIYTHHKSFHSFHFPEIFYIKKLIRCML